VLVAIPFSLISTFFVMFLLGFSLNTMSLMALALLIGILVDDSIVVLENINRHLEMGEPPATAAVNGRWEIGVAAIAITCVDVVVYLPVAFMNGNIGQLFREFGLTIVAATLFSMMVSFTLTPMLASRLLEEGSLESEGKRGLWNAITGAWDRTFVKIRGRYQILLGYALNVRWLPVLIGFGMLALVASFIPLRIVGTEYAPNEDNGTFTVQLNLPVGASVDSTSQAMEIIEGRLLALPEVRTVFASVGSSGGTSALSVQEQNGAITVGLVDKSERKRTIFEIVRQVRAFGADIPGLQLRTQVPSPLVGGGGSPIQLRITGQDADVLNRLTEQVLEIVQHTPGTAEVRSSAILPVPEFQAIVNGPKAAEYGITAQTIANTLNAAVGGVVASQFRQQGREQIDIVLQLVGAETMTPEDLGAIPVIATGGLSVRLDQVATIVPGDGAGQISRFNRARGIQVLSNVNGRSMGDVLNDIQREVKELTIPTGYAVTTAGQSSQLDATFAALIGALVLSIVLMYMLMAALYESFIFPFAVIACLPVALVGAILGLWLDGSTLNVFSMIGMIMLMGLVAKNAILLVDYTNTLRKRGLNRREALLEAGPTRLRPITMTTVTLLIAMAPLALKMGAGAESRSPMAIVVIGGMITSTLLTLFLVPCAYTYLDDLQNLLLRRKAQAVESLAVGKLIPEVAISGGSDE
jgi:HAE1 family hydrophobic/amphiphilic exporter-1